MFVPSNGKSTDEQTPAHQAYANMMDWDMPEMNGIEAIEIIMNNSILKIK
jgi:CheY-like chemotaxis protein